MQLYAFARYEQKQEHHKVDMTDYKVCIDTQT